MLPFLRSFPLLVVLLLPLSACVSIEELREAQAHAEALREGVRQDIADLEQIVAGLPTDDPARHDANAAIAELQALEAALDAADARIDAVVRESEAPSDPISHLVGAIAPWLPEPARTPILLGSALLVSLWRGHRLKEGFRSVVKGIDRAVKDDAAFSEAFRRNAPTFRASQTPTAQRLVDLMSNRPAQSSVQPRSPTP